MRLRYHSRQGRVVHTQVFEVFGTKFVELVAPLLDLFIGVVEAAVVEAAVERRLHFAHETAAKVAAEAAAEAAIKSGTTNAGPRAEADVALFVDVLQRQGRVVSTEDNGRHLMLSLATYFFSTQMYSSNASDTFRRESSWAPSFSPPSIAALHHSPSVLFAQGVPCAVKIHSRFCSERIFDKTSGIKIPVLLRTNL